MDRNYNKNSQKEPVEILLVEDDEIFAESLKSTLEDEGYIVTVVKNGKNAIELIEKKDFSLILSDINLPGKSGFEVLKAAKKVNKFSKVFLITGFGTIEKAVEAMKMGAEDFITKPFEVEELLLKIERIIEYKQKEELLEKFNKIHNEKSSFYGIVGKSKKMKEVFQIIEAASKSDANVLITGESGTGKELVANAIQALSDRKNKPFIKINCAAIPEHLLESELFGYEKGAFTGAIKSYKGKFLAANGGTIFLDEIGELSYNLQSKLLRVIEDKNITPLGSNKTYPVDVRIISATHQNLYKLIEENKFRSDLFYRLNVISIHIPPLRERKEDIPLLIEHFIRKFSEKYNKEIKISENFVMELLKKDYPGNVRELENIIHSHIVLNKDEIKDNNNSGKELLFGVFDITKPYNEVMSDFEKIYLSEVLKKCNYKKTLAAQVLQISRKNLWEKLKKYNLGSDVTEK